MATTPLGSSRRRTTSTTWACNECKKRKGRCSGGTPCTFCSRTRRVCEYGDRPSRTPLTRKNLDRMEARCRMLENMLRQAKPGISLDHIDSHDARADHAVSTEGEDDSDGASPDDDDAHSDSLPGYGWREGPITGHDEAHEPTGMAFVSDRPAKAGFLGESSAQQLLNDIESYLSLNTPSSDLLEKATRAINTKDPEHRRLKPNKLVAPEVKRAYIADYFFYFNTFYPIVDEADFWKKYDAPASEPRGTDFQVLSNAILALGAFVGCRGSTNDDLPFYVEARSKLSLKLVDSGSLTNVQSLLLLGNYVQKRDRPNTGYVFTGLACRIATALGLHRTSQASGERSYTGCSEQMKRRIFWSLYIIEAGFAFTTGRPPAIDVRHVNLPLPADTNDTGPDAHAQTPRMNKQAQKLPTCCSALIYQIRFAEIQNRVHGEFINPKLPLNEAMPLVTRFEHELDSWRSSLPAYDTKGADWFYPPWTVLSWRERNLRMVMMKTLLSCPSDLDPSDPEAYAARQHVLNETVEVAVATLESTCDFAERGQACVRGVNWYAMYFLIQAVLVMDLSWLQVAATPSHDFELVRRRAQAALQGFGQTCPSAIRCLQFLERIQEHYRQTSAVSFQLIPPASASLSSPLDAAGALPRRPLPDYSAAATAPTPPPAAAASAAATSSATPNATLNQHMGSHFGQQAYDARLFNHDFWYDPNVNPFLEDPFVAPVFDDMAFFPT